MNPSKKITPVINALSLLEDRPWEYVYIELAVSGYNLCSSMSSYDVWSDYLKSQNYTKCIVLNKKHTVSEFCESHKSGRYLLVTDNDMTTVINGNCLGLHDLSSETVLYYYTKERLTDESI